MLYAAKILGVAGYRFLTDPDLRQKAREEWQIQLLSLIHIYLLEKNIAKLAFRRGDVYKRQEHMPFGFVRAYLPARSPDKPISGWTILPFARRVG